MAQFDVWLSVVSFMMFTSIAFKKAAGLLKEPRARRPRKASAQPCLFTPDCFAVLEQMHCNIRRVSKSY